MNWKPIRDTPAREYFTGPYLIRWDPAGEREGERGGWYLYWGRDLLGIFPTLKQAKAEAEAREAKAQ